MWLRKSASAAAAVTLISGLSLAMGGPAQAAGGPGLCWGATACAGNTLPPANCVHDEEEIEDRQVPGMGDILLYESPSCGTAWAVLRPPGSALTLGPPQLAEIFYEPPQGGAEQFATASWDQTDGDVATTTMVPFDGSVKACGGNANNDPNGAPFDEDPQGINDLFESPSSYDDFADAACTLWH